MLNTNSTDLSEGVASKVNAPLNGISSYPTQHILFIAEENRKRPEESAPENLYFTYATVEKASILMDPESKLLLLPDVIVVSSELENYTDKYLMSLKEFSDAKSIPFILYSEKFNKMARHIAAEFEFDDYVSGPLTISFSKKCDFIRKSKEYKSKKDSSLYKVNHHHNAPPEFKMWALKRTFDIIVSASMLILLSPLLLIIAIIIKLESKGSIFYISKRAGNGYKIFDFYKFRSMRQGADAELKKLAHMNQYGDAVFFKIQNDPRVTRFGSFLRNSSLDEIPQLINVLKGDMSLVGNRPLPLYEAEKLTKDQIAWRFLAPAGITGLWQVTKRGKKDMSEEERIQLDMQYAMNNSLLFDVKILWNTIPALLQKEKV